MKFREPTTFSGSTGYGLLPLRFRRLPWDEDQVLVTSLSGDWLILSRTDLDRLVDRKIDPEGALFADLEARHLVVSDADRSTFAPLISQYRARKAYLEAGPALHIFVVSLRCHHSCPYCQVSRQGPGATAFDMSRNTANFAIERLFEWPATALTVEFQGGEPLLHFDQVRALTEAIQQRNIREKRALRFVLASTLHDITDDQLAFLKEHGFQLSTSLDGPEWLHNANRPRPERDSYRRTLLGIERGRQALGDDAVSALTTLTRRSLDIPCDIVDEYKHLGFHSISLRPLSPYGFARRTKDRLGYPIDDFMRFYAKALDHILDLNRAGYEMEESHASLLLSQIFTPFAHGYVDLRSPTGAGLGVIVYDHDGRVYPSDEARMLAAMGDQSLAIGTVHEPVSQWLASPAMTRLLDAGVAESLPICTDCAYVPFCGADPVDHYARQGDPFGFRPSSDFCRKQLSMFDLLLQRWDRGNPEDRRILEGWAIRGAGVTADSMGGG